MRLVPAILMLAVSAFAADPKLDTMLKAVETRYNKAKTLQVLFTEQYTPLGKARRTESGKLLLLKPKRMRWEYAQPKGNLAVSDGKFMWVYNADENRAEKQKLQDTEDMHAPLAFLLGKLNFGKEFRNIEGHPEGDGMRITADPKSEDLSYKKVDFLVAADSRIRYLKVTSFDQSVLEFTFDQEKMDPPLDPKLFVFEPPKGAEIVEGQ